MCWGYADRIRKREDALATGCCASRVVMIPWTRQDFEHEVRPYGSIALFNFRTHYYETHHGNVCW